MTEKQLAHWVDAAAERLIDESQCLPGRVLPEYIAAPSSSPLRTTRR